MTLPKNSVFYASKVGKGGGEGAFVMALTDLAVNSMLPLGPFFVDNRASLYIVFGAIVGGVIHPLASKFLWRS